MFKLLLASILSVSSLSSVELNNMSSADSEYDVSAPRGGDSFNSCFGLTNSIEDVCDYIVKTQHENGKDVIIVEKISKSSDEYNRIQTIDYPTDFDGNLVGLSYVMCFNNNKPAPHMLALVNFDDMKETSEKVLFAWDFSFNEQKLKEVSVKNISCENPGYGI